MTGSQGPQGEQGPPGDTDAVEGRIAELEARVDSLVDEMASLAGTDSGTEDPSSIAPTSPPTSPATPLPAEDPPENLVGKIPDLASISFYWLSENWDADADDDGMKVSISFKDQQGNYVNWTSVRVAALFEIYIAEEYGSSQKKYDEPIFRKWFILTYSSEKIQVPYEEFVPGIPVGDYWENISGGYSFSGILELTILQSDGSAFSDREVRGVGVPK